MPFVPKAKTELGDAGDLSLIWAVKLLANFGDRDGVIAVLEQLVYFKGTRARFDDRNVITLRFETALALCETAGGTDNCHIQISAVREEHTERALKMFSEAYDTAAEKSRWADVGRMADVVRKPVKLCYNDEAVHLATRAIDVAKNSRNPFKTFDLLRVARALSAAGAAKDLIKEVIEAAIVEFPTKNGAVISWGLISGPIKWGEGLKTEDEVIVAELLMDNGNFEAALDWVEKFPENIHVWIAAGLAASLRERDLILSQVEFQLSKGKFEILKARIVSNHLFIEKDLEHSDWADSELQAFAQAPISFS